MRNAPERTRGVPELPERTPGRLRERPGALQSVREHSKSAPELSRAHEGRRGGPESLREFQSVREHSESALEHTKGVPERWRASESAPGRPRTSWSAWAPKTINY